MDNLPKIGHYVLIGNGPGRITAIRRNKMTVVTPGTIRTFPTDKGEYVQIPTNMRNDAVVWIYTTR